MNCDELAGHRLTVCEQELLKAFAHLMSISSNFLQLLFQLLFFLNNYLEIFGCSVCIIFSFFV